MRPSSTAQRIFDYKFFRVSSPTIASTAEPYRSNFRGPTPGSADNSARLCGRASATAASVASGNTTNAGTSSSSAVAFRHTRSVSNSSASAPVSSGRRALADFFDGGRESAAPPAASTTGGPRQRPREREMLPGPGNTDIKQPAFLGNRLFGGRVLNRERAVGQADEKYRVPFESLRRVQ